MSVDMHNLIGKYFNGQATEEEVSAVKQWRSATESNEKEFQLLEKIWNQPGKQVSFNANTAWLIIDNKLNGGRGQAKLASRIKRISIAAAACLLLSIITWWILAGNSSMHTVIADTAMQTLKLQDGSTVYLRKGASLRYPGKFKGNERRVKLTGEAFFEVVPDKSRPFFIDAAATEIRVVGTSFSVHTTDQSVELVVRTGIVQFGPAGDTSHALRVVAGERALFEKGAVTKQANDDPNFNAWQSGKLVFDNTALKKVLEELGAYYTVSFTVQDENKMQLETTGVTATFDNESLPAAINELSLITTYRVEQTGKGSYKVYIR